MISFTNGETKNKIQRKLVAEKTIIIKSRQSTLQRASSFIHQFKSVKMHSQLAAVVCTEEQPVLIAQ